MRIAVIASYGTGLTMRLDRVPARGETVGGAEFSAGPGGKGSNQAIGAARLGAEVYLLTAVGDDDFGRTGSALWRAEGVRAEVVVVPGAATMAGVILVEPDGENRIVIAPGALEQLTPARVRDFAASIADADLMMVCNEIPADTVGAALLVAHRHGVPTLLNPAPARQLDDALVDVIDYLTPNLGEARLLAGADEAAGAQTVLDLLRRRFRATVVLTCGGEGAWVDDGTTREHLPAITAGPVVDTTGAGDAFNAALAVGLAGGWSPGRAARFAAAAGAFAVTRHEVIPGLPHPADLTPLLPADLVPPADLALPADLVPPVDLALPADWNIARHNGSTNPAAPAEG